MISKDEFDEHLKTYHKQSTISGYLREMVYGGTDGIVTTFAVVAGFSGADILANDTGVSLPIIAVLLFGMANLLADGLSMGIGDFLSSRAEKKQYEDNLKRELQELDDNLEFEYAETQYILKNKGIAEEDAGALLNIYQKYPDFWIEFMMRYELNLAPPDDSPFKGALVTFLSFIVFGLIPLIPYILRIQALNMFIVSSISAIIALTLLGILRSKFTSEKVISSIFETVILGIIAGSVAYGVGLIFGSNL